MTTEKELFDGELLGRRLEAFLGRVDHALNIAIPALTNFYADDITVVLSVDAGFNVSFAGFGGINADRTRTFEFALKPKRRTKDENACAYDRCLCLGCRGYGEPLRDAAGAGQPP